MSERTSATGLPWGGPAGERGPFGPEIQSFRRRAGLSQEEAALRAGISTRALRDIERGRVQRPQSRTLQRLGQVLGLTGGELAELLAAARTAPPRVDGRPRLLILGPLSLQRGQTPVPVSSPMLRRLLGLLALKHPEPSTQQEITDTLWPSGPPSSHQSLMHTYISQVRQLLEPAGLRTAPPPTVVRTPTGYLLQASRNQIDLGQFDELLAQAKHVHRAPDPRAAYESLTQALQRWRGPVLADADPVLRLHPAAVAANERRVEAVLLHADTALLLRRPEEAVRVLWDMVNTEPLHEGLHARLILTLASCGEQAAALNVFSRLRDRLDEELGIAPSAEVRDAHLRVLRQQLPLAQRPEHPAPAERMALPAQLPARTGPYVGRRRQLRDLDALVSPDPAGRSHVVAVVGAPGVGKTALATQWAHARREHFEDGQLFVDLRGHSALPTLRPADVLAQFLRALGAPPDQLPADEDEAAALYRTLLADKQMLIVLDNARDSEQVRPLIPGAQRCAVVITSRSRLAGLVASDGARQLVLDVLDPDEARQLLASTVGERRVAAEQEAADRLVKVCGGLPLAIRIAGANLLARDAAIADYCAELAGDDMLSRLHIEGDRRSTVRATFDLSYRALPAAAQRVFRLLSLMPGPDLTVHGAAALADSTSAESAGLLVSLTDAHLVQERAASRFGLHDLLRSYARELVSREEAHAARQRLFDWYLYHTEAAARLLYPAEPASDPCAGAAPSAALVLSDHGQAAQWLDSERENLAGAVLQASGAGFTAVAWRLAESLHGYLSVGKYTGDCLKVATASLFAAVADGELRAQAAAQLRRGECHWVLANNAQALELFGSALELARQADWLDGQALALRRIGAAHQESGAMRLASDYLSRARDLTRPGNGAGTADDVTNLGLICWKLGRLHEAAEHFSHAAQLFRDLDSSGGEAVSQTNLGIAYRALGRPGDAIRVLGETLPIHRRNGNRLSETVALCGLSGAYTDLGDHSTGRLLAHTALSAAQALRNRRLEANAFLVLGATQERAHDLTEAADSYREAVHLAEVVNDRFPQVAALVGLGGVQARLEPQAALPTAERAVTLSREAEFRMLEGCALNVLACVRIRLGDSRSAAEIGRDALALHRETGHRPGEARSQLALGYAQSALGARGEAFEHWREMLRLSRAMGGVRIR
ncbi:DNA-binding SARP family transcriptional activator/DNA-binding XRE family transcriptional regulator/Ni2+-binding GTPase involved in maturation of urease and hydrogenase [Kitasatospora sp. MAA4]|uniref:BTAD domain-containing putative transcriptional regulator n=1 Tax=Kitasatospora sp. MAA4 TaxID=3035093 RepID=UPI002474BA20|nr:BTAD domain-containing putative transcriptional regulator [Kitasatospora sp. MAA4]MDH6131208.1 DNA-binding SARP family transcriptional activator/DNA-binding XRE family transcriptional regulator/Ni2+-binding GTPase involved in maturation of urease and hydrogenase [Kitasatospora sp. MAA4]